MRRMVAFTLAATGALGSLALPARPAAAGECGGGRELRVVRVREPRVFRLASETVRCHRPDAYRVRLVAGERVRLFARGDGDIDLLVFDACGRLVAADEACDSAPSVRFAPRHSGVYTIQIVNSDRSAVEYALYAE